MGLTTYLVANTRDLHSDYTLHAAIEAATDHTTRRALWRRDDNRITIDTPLEPLPVGWQFEAHTEPPQPARGMFVVIDAWLNPSVSRKGKRHALPVNSQADWAEEQFHRVGLHPVQRVRILDTRTITGHRRGTGRLTLIGTRFAVLAAIEDPEVVRAALLSGVGHGKAFGLGLLTLTAPERP